MNSRGRFAIGVAAIMVVASAFLFLRGGEDTAKSIPSAPGLERSEAVVAAKIARKQAKIAGEHKGAQHPDGYAEHRSMVRSHPEGTNVTQLLLEAKRHVETMPQVPGDRDAGIWDWYWLGPGNIGGRVRAILTHPGDPDILWAGSVSGGIWKTTNGGLLWHPQDDFLPSLAITSLAMDPINPDIIYAGTGEGFAGDGLPGAGVFRSFDGGDNWTQLMDIVDPDAYFVYDIAHHPSVSGELLACTSDQAKTGKIWHTTNNGGVTATAAGGQVTGFRAGHMDATQFTGALIIDDPVKPDDAYSETTRKKVNESYNETVASRVAIESVPIIVIMQRIHWDDLSGYLLRGGSGESWHHLCLPVKINSDDEYPEEYKE